MQVIAKVVAQHAAKAAAKEKELANPYVTRKVHANETSVTLAQKLKGN